MKLPEKVLIREVAPRDGFQSWPNIVPTETKVAVIKAAIKAGVKEFETTSFVNPKAVPQMADAVEVIKQVPREGIVHAALVPNLKGAENAVAAGVDQLNVVISASEEHNMANFRRPIADSISALEPIFKLANANKKNVLGAIAVAFGCPFAGEVPILNVVRLVEIYINNGCQAVALGDTTGMATPLRVQQLIGAIKERFPEIPVGLHLHNNRGTGMANLLAGLQAGVTMFDASLGGIGGCPNVPQASGNLATEDVVCMLEDMGISTGIDLRKLIEAALFLEKELGQTLPGQVLKSGPIEVARNSCGCTKC